jgi:hypothetical protein
MDLKKMIGELEAERDRLDHAILALERLSRAPQSKRGRPPKWLSDITSGDSHASKAQVNGKK